MKYSGHIWIILIFLLAACDTGSQRSINREALQEEMRNREPKKLSEAQIVAEAFRQGQEIADKTQQDLLERLKEAMEEGSTIEALQYCNIQALPLTDSAILNQNVTVKRTSLKLRNPKNAPTDLEQQLLDAYQYNAEQGLPLEENVQRVGNEYLLYTKPITIGSTLCLHCHGEPQKDIDPETHQLIKQLYPTDKAVGYQIGDFRGMWSVKLPQKKIVNDL